MEAQTKSQDWIAGRNAVREALQNDRQIDVLYVSETATGSIGGIVRLAKEKKIVIKQVSPQKLNQMCPDIVHQGVIAQAAVVEYVALEDILQSAADKNEPPFLLLCDGIEDPHNLGALLRTAEAVGVHGVILPKRRSATVNATVYKTSAGAAGIVPVCRVSNLAQTIRRLQEQGIWVYCADMDGQNWCGVSYQGGCALVVGAEGKGVSRVVKEQTDITVRLPMVGQINSLNASVAAGVLLYEMARQRLQLPAVEIPSTGTQIQKG